MQPTLISVSFPEADINHFLRTCLFHYCLQHQLFYHSYFYNHCRLDFFDSFSKISYPTTYITAHAFYFLCQIAKRQFRILKLVHIFQAFFLSASILTLFFSSSTPDFPNRFFKTSATSNMDKLLYFRSTIA